MPGFQRETDCVPSLLGRSLSSTSDFVLAGRRAGNRQPNAIRAAWEPMRQAGAIASTEPRRPREIAIEPLRGLVTTATLDS